MSDNWSLFSRFITEQPLSGHELETISQLHMEIARVKRRLSNQYVVKEEAAFVEPDPTSSTSSNFII